MNFFFELKNRLLFILFSVLITTLAAVNYKEFIIYSITIPIIESQKDIQNVYFIYTNLTDIFDAYIKIFLLVAFQSFIFACSYQIFSFLTPALYKTEHKIFKNMLWVTTLSVNITHLLLCKIIIPLTIIFFENLQYSLEESGLIFYFENKINEYITFYIQIYFITYIVCMLFLVFTLYFFHQSEKKNYVKTQRKAIYITSYIIAAFITPPDVISQIILFSVITLIFENIVFVFLVYDKLIRKPVETY